MRCEEAFRKLEDYSYGEIRGAESAGLVAHLRECDSCRAAYELILEENEAFYGYVSDTEVKPEMWDSVRAGIRGLSPVARWGSIAWLKNLLGAAPTVVPTPTTEQYPTEGSMNQNIFTFIEYDPLWVSFTNELQQAARDFAKDPKKFIFELFQADPTQAKRKRYLRVGVTCAMFFWVFCSFVYAGLQYHRASQTTSETAGLQKITDLTRFPSEVLQGQKAKQRAGGGGGGGNHESTPQSQGRLPKSSLEDSIVAPSTHPPKIEAPSLPVVPMIKVQPGLLPEQALNIPLGDPKGVPGPPSDGPGEGGGIGNNRGGGVGPGDGKGYGPGKDFNAGNGVAVLGGGDDDPNRIYTPGNGIKQPQILDKTKPKYTEDARRNKIQGVVVVSAVFRLDGTISDLKVVRGLGYGLDEEAIKAAAKIRFVPGQRNGKSVNVRAVLEFTFSLL
jgi:TonB family protein